MAPKRDSMRKDDLCIRRLDIGDWYEYVDTELECHLTRQSSQDEKFLVEFGF